MKMAWHYAKQEAERIAQTEVRMAAEAAILQQHQTENSQSKEKAFYNSFGKIIAKQYRNVTFGKNDYCVSYGRRYY